MSHNRTNGASLEDCHANFFALTDVCGIKWCVFGEQEEGGNWDVDEDPVLESFGRCLEAEILAVWRAVPKRSSSLLNSFDYNNEEEKADPGTRKKELWIFWYGDRPEDLFKKIINGRLTENSSGTWEDGLPYEARTLLYKALNNLIERSLIRKDFVRLGKWFVQPFEGPERPTVKASHLSFSFQYFVHGESSVCASLDVRQHPAIRRLSLHHLSGARSNPVRVILAPYGLAGTLTGITYKTSDSQAAGLLKKWHLFYLLDKNKYFCLDNSGELVTMPPAVEVCVAGVKLVYPTSYVLVTDIDHHHYGGNDHQSMHTFRCSEDAVLTKSDFLPYEPSPYTGSNHPLLHIDESFASCRIEDVWCDGIRPSHIRPAPAGGAQSVTDILSHWDFTNPGKIVKKKSRSRSKEKSGRATRFGNSKVPFHKKMEPLDELGWTLDQSEMISTPGRGNSSQTVRQPESVKDTLAPSPATPAAALTPKRTPGGTFDIMSPAPLSVNNGPATPNEPQEAKQPQTPLPTYPGIPSPFISATVKTEVETSSTATSLTSTTTTTTTTTPATTVVSPPTVTVTSSSQILSSASIFTGGSLKTEPSSEIAVPTCLKRPALPTKEYEEDLCQEEKLSDNIYDYRSMIAWLEHPVKKFKMAETRSEDPLRPMYRRASQEEMLKRLMSPPVKNQSNSSNPATENSKIINGTAVIQPQHDESGDPYEFNDNKNKQPQNEEDKKDWLTSDGLKPSMGDLDNLFDDSSDETEPTGVNPTPPNSNKPSRDEEGLDIVSSTVGTSSVTKLSKASASKADQTGSLHHDQLAKMFPTPPSHEHNPIASPAEDTLEVKTEPPGSPWASNSTNAGFSDFNETTDDELSSTKFGPLNKLYSDDLPPLTIPPDCIYKPRNTKFNQQQQQSQQFRDGSQNNSGAAPPTPNSVPTPQQGVKPGMSPISPLHSVEGGPRSHHGPGSNYGIASSPASSNFKSNKQAESSEKGATIVADSLVLNLVLSETLLNIFRDHNFDSCTMCVCSNDGNIKGRDATAYLKSDFGGDEDINCNCGYSAVVNRKLAHQTSLFYEDESEVTSITEDLYYRKKPSLLMLLNEFSGNTNATSGSNSNNNTNTNNTNNNSNNSNNNNNNNAGSIVDSIPPSLLELIAQQCSFHPPCSFDTLVKYSEQYLKSTAVHNQHNISMVELMDGNDVIFLALDQVKHTNVNSNTPSKLDESQKQTCLHKWTLLQAEGPYCSEDIIRVMKSLQPILNETLHVRSKAGGATNICVEGPLTWRQFHRMAGPSTKGNTDDQCEPLPVPTVTVGHERDFLSISPLALHFWEALSLEPFSQPRDVAYIVVAPDNELVMNSVKAFFKNLSSIYELCRLGKHVPITRVLRDGVLKVGRSAAGKLANAEVEEWFQLIGDSHTAGLLKLYAQVCRHYLLPHLNTIPFDRSLLETEKKAVFADKPPGVMAPPSSCIPGLNDGSSNAAIIPGSKVSSGGDTNLDGEAKEGKECAPETVSSDDTDGNAGEAPAIVIYMVDPFSLSSDNLETTRLCSLGLLRCFNQLVPLFNDTLKHNVYLQLVSMDNILELTQSKSQSRMTNQLRGMAFSVYSQAQRPLHFQKECKTLTGFGPASCSEKYLKTQEEKLKLVRHLRCPTFVLASPPLNTSDTDSYGSGSSERSEVLFCSYCLSEDQHCLLASCSDGRGELLKTIVINIEIPNKTRRKKASARRVGLRKLMDWILGVMAMNLIPWRLVIGRIGRIGHGELRGWSVLLSRKALKKASKQLREMCSWSSDVPSILSACLISTEPDSHLRLMADQFTPDERFGQTASNCQLSTPKDASCTHILVFPTSATAQSSQEAFRDHQEGIGSTANDLDDFGLPELEDIDQGDDGVMDMGDIGDLFEDTFDNNMVSPGSPGKRNSLSQPTSPNGGQGNADAFRYGQEEPGERIEILQQPLALGYLVSTAKTGTMPRWFWASCPHLEHVCPVFLKSALHINVASVLSGGDDGFMPQTGRVHSLDSSYTTDVLRYVLEGYNALSWLSLDPVTHDRKSCLPIHVQVLSRMYGALASLL